MGWVIALATCSEFPFGDEHDRLLADALGGAPFVVWDDPAVDWSQYDRVVVRGTWDYTRRVDEFLAWTRAVGDRLVNAPALITWNADKRYLAELAAHGLPVVPTTVVEPGDALPEFSGEAVVKPTVSAGSRDTARFQPSEHRAAARLLAAIHASGRAALVQPYVGSVDTRGETALVYFDGAFSHALGKRALLRPGGVEGANSHTDPDAMSVREATDAERHLAEQVLGWVRNRFGAVPTIARVDLVDDAGGRPQLMELEVIEPCLFFALVPEAAPRLAAALRR